MKQKSSYEKTITSLTCIHDSLDKLEVYLRKLRADCVKDGFLYGKIPSQLECVGDLKTKILIACDELKEAFDRDVASMVRIEIINII